MENITLNQIQDFVENETFALFGVSTVKHKFGNNVLLELSKKGATIFPIHKTIQQIENHKCYKNIQEIPQKVSAAIICTAPQNTDIILNDIKTLGITKLWLQKGSTNPKIIETYSKYFDNFIHGKCIFMFYKLEGIHHFHKKIIKFFGTLPK